MATWITPKTDWVKTDSFTYTDYNRIKNNLTYLNDLFNSLAPEKAVEFDFGEDYTYANNYDVDIFNMFEECLQSFTRIGSDVNVGEFKVHRGNSQFLDYDDLNRIEKCCVNWLETTRTGVKSVTVTPATFEFYSGNEVQLVATVLPEDAYNKSVTWSSSDTSVATVDENGVVTCIGRGNATITCTTVDGHKTATSICEGHKVEVFPFNVANSDTISMGYADNDYQYYLHIYFDTLLDDTHVDAFNSSRGTSGQPYHFDGMGFDLYHYPFWIRLKSNSLGTDSYKWLNSKNYGYFDFTLKALSSGYRIYSRSSFEYKQAEYSHDSFCYCGVFVRTGKTQQCYCRTLTSTSNVTSGNTWYSSNPSIFTVNSSGLVTGISEGNAVLAVKHNNIWAFSIVHVVTCPDTVTLPSVVNLARVTSNTLIVLESSVISPSYAYEDDCVYSCEYWVGTSETNDINVPFRCLSSNIGKLTLVQRPDAESGTLTIKFVTNSGLVTKSIRFVIS